MIGRYFFVGYSHPRGMGNFCLKSSGETGILNQAMTQSMIGSRIGCASDQVVLINIYEFKSLDEYNAFQSSISNSEDQS